MPTLSPLKVMIVGGDEYTKEFTKFTRKIAKIGQSVTKLGRTMTTSLTLPIAGVGIAGIKMSNDLNAAMANVGTLIPGEREKLKGYKGEVMSLAVEAGTASTIISEGLYESISAFSDAANPLKKLDISTKMSVAGLSTVKEALSLVSAVTKGYGDVSDEAAQKVSDMSFLTVKLGQTTFPDLASSIGKVVPFATTLNVGMKELFGSFATLTGVTGNASEVATQLRSALGAFITPSAAMTRAAKKLGHESSIAMVESLGLAGALKTLGDHVDNDAIKLGKLITRKEGLNAALTLLGPQAENFTKKVAAMGNVSGTTAAALLEQTDGINKSGFRMKQLTEKFKNFLVVIGDKLAPILMRGMDYIEGLMDKFEGLSDESLITGMKIAGLVAAIGPLLIIIGKTVTASAGLMSFIGGAGGLAGIAAALTGPVGWAIAAVAALTAAVIYFRDELRPLGEAVVMPFVEAFREMVEIFSYGSGNLDGFGSVLKMVVGFLADATAPVVKLGLKLYMLPFRHVVRGARLVMDVLGFVSKAFGVVSSAVGFAWAWLGKMWVSFSEGTAVGKVVNSVFETIGDAIGGMVTTIKDAWKVVSNFFEDIGVALDAVSMQLDSAAANQNRMAYGMIGDAKSTFNDPWNMEVDQTVMHAINNQDKEMTLNLELKGLPDGVTAEVTGVKGAKPNVKTNGPSMTGAV